MGFWGLGFNGTNMFFIAHGFDNHAFHNAYLNMFFQFGWPMILVLIPIIITAIKIIKSGLQSENKFNISMALILLSGLMLALFEPTVIFGTLGGYSIWWFAFGYLFCQQKSISRNKFGYSLNK